MQLISFDLDSYLYIISLVIIFTHVVFLRKLNEEKKTEYIMCLSNVTAFSFLLILIIASLNVIYGNSSFDVSIVFIFTLLNLVVSFLLYKFFKFRIKILFYLKLLVVASILMLIVSKYITGGISHIEKYSFIIVYLVGFLFLVEKK